MENVMAANLASIKLPVDLVDQARRDAAVFSRSISGQVEHWARLGQAIESAPGFTLDRVQAALEGRFNPGDLTEDEWRIYDDMAWDALGKSPVDPSLFDRAGAVEEDEQGNLLRVAADGTVQPLSLK